MSCWPTSTIAAAGGQICLAEEALAGRRVTVEGYRYRGNVVVYGVVESMPCDNIPSFLRFQYPASLPQQVTDRLCNITRRVIEAIGLEGMTFNVEYFWNPDTDAINLPEINPRHSQSHTELFEHVDGMTDHQVMLRLALGRDPEFPHGNGRYTVAAKYEQVAAALPFEIDVSDTAGSRRRGGPAGRGSDRGCARCPTPCLSNSRDL